MDSAIEVENPVTMGFVVPGPLSQMHERTQAMYAEILRSCEESGGLPPGIRELQSALKISSTSVVSYHLRCLEKAGLIRIFPGRSRGISVVGGSWSPPVFTPAMLTRRGVAA